MEKMFKVNFAGAILIILPSFLVFNVPVFASADDCNECQQWEDSPRGCQPLPEGTAVPNEPCKECDGASGQRNKADGDQGNGTFCCGGEDYDPATQGCCPDPGNGGQSTVTSNPENADPNQVAIDNGYCSSSAGPVGGATFCYNGELITAMCPDGLSKDPAIQACIQAHEDVHKNDTANLSCNNCLTSNPSATESERKASECAAYTVSLDCINGVDPSTPGWAEYRLAQIVGKADNCP